MADVNMELTREFFEMNGFFVKTGTYLYVKNPAPLKKGEGDFLISADNPGFIERAVVSVKPWHSEAFFPSRIKAFPELFKFLGRKELEKAAAELGSKTFSKILVVSKMPSSRQTLERSIGILKEQGVDRVLQFPEILKFLIKNVRTNVNYTENDSLQLLRILKSCGFFGVGQLELFKK